VIGQQLRLWDSTEKHHKLQEGLHRHALEQKYATLLQERLDLVDSVSYIGNKRLPLMRLYRYKEAFAFTFVQQVIKQLALSESDLVLDPFCGMGTTLFTAGLQGIPSWGVDKLPIAVFIARTLPLFLTVERGSIRETYQQLRFHVDSQPLAPIAEDVAIMKVAFAPEILTRLRKWKSAIDTLDSPMHEIMTLLFLSILEECSYTSKDGQFLRLNRQKQVAEPSEALERKVQEAERDLSLVDQLGWRKSWRAPVVIQGDARQMPPAPLRRATTALITSPPYVNRYDYTRSYSLELCFAFVRNFEELKALRFGILRSHIEARVQPDERPCHHAVQEVLQALEQRRQRLNNPRIPAMIAGYFVDMEQVIQEWARILAPAAWVVMVVDNVRFDGEMIPVDLILCDMAERVGFKTEAIWIARYKGNSSQQMGRYGRVPVRESVLIWRKRST
jgi:hypothetical protein